MGTIYDIVYEPDSVVGRDLPLAVLVRFDKFSEEESVKRKEKGLFVPEFLPGLPG